MNKRQVIPWVLLVLVLFGVGYAIYSQRRVKADAVVAGATYGEMQGEVRQVDFASQPTVNGGVNIYYDRYNEIIAKCSANCPEVGQYAAGIKMPYLAMTKNSSLDLGKLNPFYYKTTTSSNVTDSATVGFWLNMGKNQENDTGTFVIMGNSNGNVKNAGMFVHVDSDHKLGVSISNGTKWYGKATAGTWRDVLGVPAASTSSAVSPWKYITVTYGEKTQANHKLLKLYVDGEVVAETPDGAIPDDFIPNPSPSNFVIGRNGSVNAGFVGQIAGVTVQSGLALSKSQIYSAMRSSSYSPYSIKSHSTIAIPSDGPYDNPNTIFDHGEIAISVPSVGDCVSNANSTNKACSDTVKSTDSFCLSIRDVNSDRTSSGGDRYASSKQKGKFSVKLDSFNKDINGVSSLDSAKLSSYSGPYIMDNSLEATGWVDDICVKPGSSFSVTLPYMELDNLSRYSVSLDFRNSLNYSSSNLPPKFIINSMLFTAEN